ncbi:hypothetical protein HCC61_04305 [Streptomyces sp. HNM0575]|uniref:T4 family baseplate hub assembly chaperone n=1 Tax=Streptomyces sp. HNM0575 TaxID=2716338 RepID=UPI00145FBEE8|nr:hypothetical protein [Streptomyces sp. HNM0575]NLU71913.1 hypothetical protein [Streptomyces sp. HNM0575]
MAHTEAARLLSVWEEALPRTDADRARILHRAARPQAGPGELPRVPVGEREADLYALRRALFGDRMQVLLECAPCGEAMEFDLDAGELAARPPRSREPLRVAADGWEIDFRLPAVADLEAAAAGAAAGAGAEGDPAGAARELLVASCVVTARRDGAEVPAERLPRMLPAAVAERIAAAAEEADPSAEISLDIACPECGERTTAELDIASYLWTELDAWARDVLLDVHLLATVYGWTEPDILALSPARRRYYLELCADV